MFVFVYLLSLCLIRDVKSKSFVKELVGKPVFGQVSKAVAVACIGGALAFPIQSLCTDIDESLDPALLSIVRVKYSIKSVNTDIENGSSDARAVVKAVKSLIQNYDLRKNLKLAVKMAGSNRVVAVEHASSAFEDLSSVFEYMTDDVDNMSGRKIPPRELLTFALQATSAATKELDLLLNDLPVELVGPVNAQVKKEFNL